MIASGIDHIVVGCLDLAEGTAALTDMLGQSPGGGGAHAGFGTRNRLWGLGDIYLELIAPDPAQTPPPEGMPFGMHRPETRALLAEGPRLIAWVARSEDAAATAALSPVPLGAPVAMERGGLAWTIVLPEDRVPVRDGVLPGVIAWPGGGCPPADALAESPLRLVALHRREDAVAAEALAALGLAEAVPEGMTGGRPLRATIWTPQGPRLID